MTGCTLAKDSVKVGVVHWLAMVISMYSVATSVFLKLLHYSKVLLAGKHWIFSIPILIVPL